MKRILISLGALLLLAGCGKANFSYTLSFSTDDPGQRMALAQAASRVIQGRLFALNNPVGLTDVKLTNSGTLLSVSLPSGIGAQLTSQLQEPLNFSIMEQAPNGLGDLTVEKLGSLKNTGLTEKQIDIVTAKVGNSQQDNLVTITFNPEGQALLKQIFARNQGKIVAIVVRHHLVSSMTVGSTFLGKTSLEVSGVPSEISQAFTDDVNVGSHVTFTPVQK